MLCGIGAKEYARKHGFEVFDGPEEPLVGPLISKEARRRYEKHNRALNQTISVKDEDVFHDTVGAVCIDSMGRMAAGVSSGGISLKIPGRVGDSAIFGCGCWAQNRADEIDKNDLRLGTACSTTGTGEQLIQCRFAQSLCDSFSCTGEEDRPGMISEYLSEFCARSWGRDPAAGFIALIDGEADGMVDFIYGHTTPTMGIGHMRTNEAHPTTFISRKAMDAPFRLSCELQRLQ